MQAAAGTGMWVGATKRREDTQEEQETKKRTWAAHAPRNKATREERAQARPRAPRARLHVLARACARGVPARASANAQARA